MAITDSPHKRIGWLGMPPMRYPNAYVWMVFFSAMDVMLTWLILSKSAQRVAGGELNTDLEINPLARMVIDVWGIMGASLFKFALVMLVIIICEFIGRRRDKTARMLAWAGVLICAFPVVWSLTLLLIHRTSILQDNAESALLIILNCFT